MGAHTSTRGKHGGHELDEVHLYRSMNCTQRTDVIRQLMTKLEAMKYAFTGQ